MLLLCAGVVLQAFQELSCLVVWLQWMLKCQGGLVPTLCSCATPAATPAIGSQALVRAEQLAASHHQASLCRPTSEGASPLHCGCRISCPVKA